MQKHIRHFKKKTLPNFAFWLLGYLAWLAAGLGLVYFWRVAFYLGGGAFALGLNLAVLAFFSAIFLAVILLKCLAKQNFCLRAAIVIFLCGLMFCFATAPLQAPDEDKHFLRANAISQGQFNYNYSKAYSKDVDYLIQNFSPKMAHDIQFANRQLAPASIKQYHTALEFSIKPAPKTQQPVMFMLLPFLHQGAFMAFARLLGFTAMGQMYAGRIANLVLYSIVCYFALKNALKYRTVFLAFMLLPISLFMGASCSYDGMMLALFYLLCSYFCKESLNAKDLCVFLLALAIITYIKLPNIVLAFILLLVPKSRWKVKYKPYILVAAFISAALLFWWALGYIDGNMLKIAYPALERGSGKTAAPGAQLLFILQNPLRFMATSLLSIYESDAFLFDLGRFGWMDLKIPLAGGLSLLCLCFASVLGVETQNFKKLNSITGLLLTGILYSAAVFFGMYVLDTDFSSIRITGLQPRYFLPAFALFFLAASIALSWAVKPKFATAAATLQRQNILLCTAAVVAFFVAVLVFQNYFIGQWLPKAQGGWKLVNLFGWQ